MSIKEPCHFCAVPYGHKQFCPHPMMFKFIPEQMLRTLEQREAEQEWDLGYTSAQDRKPLPKNASPRFKMGFEYYKLAMTGRMPRRTNRPTAQIAP